MPRRIVTCPQCNGLGGHGTVRMMGAIVRMACSVCRGKGFCTSHMALKFKREKETSDAPKDSNKA